jgi:hypothetical protein
MENGGPVTDLSETVAGAGAVITGIGTVALRAALENGSRGSHYHLVASQPHGTVVECLHPIRDPFWWNLIANRPPLEHGELVLSERPTM